MWGHRAHIVTTMGAPSKQTTVASQHNVSAPKANQARGGVDRKGGEDHPKSRKKGIPYRPHLEEIPWGPCALLDNRGPVPLPLVGEPVRAATERIRIARGEQLKEELTRHRPRRGTYLCP